MLTSAPGKGTTITLELPLTVAIIQVLVIDVGRVAVAAGCDDDDKEGPGYVIPVARVERALAVDAADVSTARGVSYLRIVEAKRERLVPFFDLAMLLGLQPLGVVPAHGTAVLVGGAAFRVERILGQEEVVAKPLGAPLSALSYVAGGAILADGRAAFLLEPARLVSDDVERGGERGIGAA